MWGERPYQLLHVPPLPTLDCTWMDGYFFLVHIHGEWPDQLHWIYIQEEIAFDLLHSMA